VRYQIVQIGRIKKHLSYLEVWEIRPGIHPQVPHPYRKVESTSTGGIGNKGSPREYTHTHMGIHEDIFITRSALVISPITWDAVYLNKK
jgi:hypothetical protein